MKVAVGSPNPLKAEAVREAFGMFFDKVEVVSFEVASEVRPFPVGDTEIIAGAANRAKGAKASCPGCDYSVGIEGGVVEFAGRWFDRNYVVVLKGNHMGVGCSAGYEIDESILRQINPESDDSKKVVDQIVGGENVFNGIGVIGVLTRRSLTRKDVIRDATVCALTSFVTPWLYSDKNRD
ncbi:MAG TPA: inosine/xanthosine triphosphatase [Candidatus Bathyarchaeia archaeon]